MTHRFHVDALGDADRVRLPAGVARHLHVLGLEPGGEVVLFDGTGREVRAQLETLTREGADAVVLERREVSREGGVALTLACAVPKGRRMDTLVRSCAELGVSRIVPLVTRRSVVKPDTASRHKLQRWQKICASASEQAGRNLVAAVAPPVKLADFLDTAGAFDLAVVLSPDDDAPRLNSVLDDADGPQSVLLLVGPEGGFTDEEVAHATRFGAVACRLTRSILRVETACVAAVALAALLCSE